MKWVNLLLSTITMALEMNANTTKAPDGQRSVGRLVDNSKTESFWYHVKTHCCPFIPICFFLLSQTSICRCCLPYLDMLRQKLPSERRLPVALCDKCYQQCCSPSVRLWRMDRTSRCRYHHTHTRCLQRQQVWEGMYAASSQLIVLGLCFLISITSLIHWRYHLFSRLKTLAWTQSALKFLFSHCYLTVAIYFTFLC